MKETPRKDQSLVRGIDRWKDDVDLYQQFLDIVPKDEDLEPNGEWEAGYITGCRDRSDIMRIRIHQLFRRDYQRIPDRFEEPTQTTLDDPASLPPSTPAQAGS